MTDKPTPVAVCAVISRNRILLIKRSTGDYVGHWALLGGKIEKDEHLSGAAIREIREEAGIESEFVSFLGLVSEHLVEGGFVVGHFILNICELRPKSTKLYSSEAGEVRWFKLNKLEEMREKIVPSDYEMIGKMILKKEGRYFDCVLEKKKKELILQKFELLS